MDWLQLTSQLGTFALASGALAWLLKTVITHRLTLQVEAGKADLKADYDVQLERLKADLRLEAERELESLKADLRVSAATREVRYAKLQDQRITVVAQLYENLVLTEVAFSSLTDVVRFAGDQPEEEKQKTAVEAHKRFTAHYHTHRIFLAEELCQSVDSLIDHLQRSWVTFSVIRPREEPHAAIKSWRDAAEICRVEVPQVRKVIERSMRELLGVIDAES